MVANANNLKTGYPTLDTRGVPLSSSIVAGSVALLDAAILTGTGFLIYWIHVAAVEPERLPDYSGAIAIFTVLTLQGFAIGDLYSLSRIINPGQLVARMVAILIAGFLTLLVCAFALQISDHFSRMWTFAWFVATTLLVPTGRMAAAAVLSRLAKQGRAGRNIIIYGAGAQGAALLRHIEALQEPWIRVVGVFDDRTTRIETEAMGYPTLGNLKDLVAWARDHRTDEILIALPLRAESRLLEITQLLSVLPVDIRLSPEFVTSTFLNRPTGIEYGVPMLSVLDKPISGWAALTKQTLDFALGVVFLLISLPAIAVIAACIKYDSPGPVLFRQQRYGFNNRIIEIFKFRTMYVEHADQYAEQLTRPGDPRVTRVGAFLRRFSLDELPQLLNVLRGEMSVVGPRPHALRAKAGDKLYEHVVAHYAMRHKVKPGITGLAQVNGWRGNTETEVDLLARLAHDLHYINNWSVLLDLVIILRTVFVVIKGENSY